MPSSRATARRDNAAAPTSASCRRAAAVISAVHSARTRSRAVVGTPPWWPTRTVDASASGALDSCAPGGTRCSHSRALLAKEIAMALHVIVGKGPVGRTTAELLVAGGHEVRVLSRSGGRSGGGIDHRQVDAADADAVASAARGAAVLYN